MNYNKKKLNIGKQILHGLKRHAALFVILILNKKITFERNIYAYIYELISDLN